MPARVIGPVSATRNKMLGRRSVTTMLKAAAFKRGIQYRDPFAAGRSHASYGYFGGRSDSPRLCKGPWPRQRLGGSGSWREWNLPTPRFGRCPLDRNKMIGRRSVTTMLKAGVLFAALALAAPGLGAGAGTAVVATDDQHHRRRRQSRTDPEGDREIPRRPCEDGQPDHLHQGAGARARRQDQGAAERRPRRHRPRAHRH